MGKSRVRSMRSNKRSMSKRTRRNRKRHQGGAYSKLAKETILKEAKKTETERKKIDRMKRANKEGSRMTHKKTYKPLATLSSFSELDEE